MTIHCRTFPHCGKTLRAALMLFVAACLLSCTKEHGPEETVTGDPICWDVITMNEYQDVRYGTKALIEDYDDLRNACTILETHPAEKIGIFGSYTSAEDSGDAFTDTELWWWEKENGNPYPDAAGSASMWNYEGENVHWVNDADYVFKAYFPKSQVVLQPGSNSGKLLAVYDSQTSQYDLMVAHKALKAGSENPVLMIFKHAIAALKFEFQFINAGVSDNLIACWLENAQPNGFYTSSTLNFTEDISWPKSTADPVGTPMYYWQPVNPLPVTSSAAATAYNSMAAADNGSIYTGNNGWLLVIPQTTAGPESLQLCFKTTTGGDVVYRTGLPAMDIQPGKRHTFLVKISSTRIELKLSIADWNERDSSYEIDFNK